MEQSVAIDDSINLTSGLEELIGTQPCATLQEALRSRNLLDTSETLLCLQRVHDMHAFRG